jgi:hypothetical protein
MKNKIIDEFACYLQVSKNRNIRLTVLNNEVMITVSLFHYKLMVDAICLLIVIGVYLTYDYNDKMFYMIPVSFIALIPCVLIWTDFLAINYIGIELNTNTLKITSRNPIRRFLLKYIWKRNPEYDFSEITSVDIRSNDSFKIDFQRYYVDMRLKDKPRMVLVSFLKEEQAIRFKIFLKDMIANK